VCICARKRIYVCYIAFVPLIVFLVQPLPKAYTTRAYCKIIELATIEIGAVGQSNLSTELLLNFPFVSFLGGGYRRDLILYIDKSRTTESKRSSPPTSVASSSEWQAKLKMLQD
jgi:hypothetical protein